MAAIKPDFNIGPMPMRSYANYTRSATPTWGTAVSQLADTYMKARNKRQTAEADRQLQTEQAQRRGAWAQAIGEGATVRDIAQRDPSIISDTAFLGFLDKIKTPKSYEDILDDQGRPIAQRGPQGRTFAHPLAPEAEGPAPETWEDVASPFGHGGFGQRSSLSGKISGYQNAPSPTTAPQRRIIKGPDNLNYYEDTKERVLPNVAAPTPSPEADAPPFKDQFQMVRQLSDDWQKTVKTNAGASGSIRPHEHRP